LLGFTLISVRVNLLEEECQRFWEYTFC